MKDYSASPYFDRYSGGQDHSTKSYTRVLAKPGYVEQASEFNESQSIQRDYLERLGRAFFTDGEVVSGCTLSIENRTTLKISEGSIFIDGLVRHVDETSLTISASGTEKVVAKLVTTIVTPSNDVTLRDPAVGSDNYGMEGADREKQVVVLEIHTSDAIDTTEYHYATVYTLEDGRLPNDSVNSDNNTFSFMTDVLAERTYDENGNYKVYGLDLQPAVEPYSSNSKVKVYISAGRAYIRGYQVTKEAMFEVYLDRATDVRRVTSESHFYSANTRRYKLTHGPAASIINVTGIKAVIKEPRTRGSVRGGSEALLHAPVDQIIAVYTEIGGVREDFEYGKDYIQNGDSVDWSPTGDEAQEPDGGTTYYVDYNYNISLSINTNFTITSDLDESYLTFKTGTNLIANSRFYITYDYTLSRRDLVLMDFNGKVSVLKGRPDNYNNLITPYNGSDDFMSLGYVNVFPKKAIGSDDLTRLAEVVNYDDCRLTQNNFIAMLKRINALEDSIAQLDMERDLEEGEDTTSLKGYFTDNFESLDKSDLSYSSGSGSSAIKYTASVNFVDKELTTQATIYTKDLPKNAISSGSRDYFGDILSAPFSYKEIIRQDFVTGSMLVNPYASYGPLNKVEISPSKDSWVDRNTIKVPNTIENKVYTTESQVLTVWRSSGHRRGAFLGTTESSKTTFTGVTTSKTSSQTVARTAIEFMRVRDIAVTGSAFGANTNNISCKFNNNTVSLTPTGSTTAGTNSGTVRANANGYFTAKFTIPANTPCGKASVQLVSSNGTGTAVYEAVGTLLTTTVYDTTTITSHYTVLNTTTNTYSSDPLAQSFMLSDTYDYNLAKLDIFFKTKDSSRPAILQIRDMVNGYPGETVYSEVKLNPSVVQVSTNASKATSVELEQPVYCKAGVYYCFVVLSDSNKYSMFYAEMGKNRLGTREQLVVNPYGTGVMFSSSNASTWTAHQSSDLKFVLYRTQYTGSGEIIFNDVAIKDIITVDKVATGVALDAAYQVGGDVNDHTSKSRLEWYYRFKTNTAGSSFSEWLPIDTLVYRDFNSLAGTVTLKAVLSTDFNTSPFIDMGRVSLRMFLDSTTATYISKSIDDASFDEPYQALKISYQAYAPSNTSHSVYYQTEDGGTWNKLVPDSTKVSVIGKTNQDRVKLTTVKVDDEFVQYTWEVNRLAGWTATNGYAGAEYFKIRIDLNVEPAYRYNRPRVRKLNVIFRNNFYSITG